MRNLPLTDASEKSHLQSLVGRDRERAILREHLFAALHGRGSFALIGGEAGIGKTALAQDICRDAEAHGALVLIGHCDDRAESPYGPWVEVCGHYRLVAGAPSLPMVFTGKGTASAGTSQTGLFQQLVAFLSAVAAHQPLVLLLEDLHWADAASLDLLRFVTRNLAPLPILLIATYRTNELTRQHPFYNLIPTLVRDAITGHLTLHPLSAEAMHALVARRYRLTDADIARLVGYLERAEGNPFFAGELLRAVEEANLLRQIDHRLALDEIPPFRLSPLLRQVIVGRVARLGEEANRLLTIAAVVGQEAPIDVLAAVSSCEMEQLLALIERAAEAHIMDEAPDGIHARFFHALVREALYESIAPSRRRIIHCQVGEALAALPDPDPDTVAYHFQQTGDPRAAVWLVRAGDRAERAYAWLTAADRYAASLALMATGGTAREQGWLHYRVAVLRRYADPHGSIRTLEDATRLAKDAADDVLAACVLYFRGHLQCYTGDFGSGLRAMEEGGMALDALAPDDRDRLHSLGSIGGFTLDPHNYRGTLALRLAGTGRFAEAEVLGSRFIADNPDAAPTGATDGLSLANAYRGVAIAAAAMGRLDGARRSFARAQTVFQYLNQPFLRGVTAMQELQWVTLPYLADWPAARERVAVTAEQAWEQADASAALAELPRRFARLYLLHLNGDWDEARALAETVYAAGGSYKAVAARVLGYVARDQGDRARAWELVHAEVPQGAETDVGTGNYGTVLLLQRLAVTLALATGDLDTAQRWLTASDRWLAWSGAVLGRAEGQLSWSTWYQSAGDMVQAYAHAARSLHLATEPRQPLALLAAHRLLGELDTAADRYADATAHLDAALTLADACAAPFERALTLLAIAEQRAATDKPDEAIASLDEVCAICNPLDAKPTLARAHALIARLTPHAGGGPAGLTAREIEVLRLLAAGHTNRQIAVLLSLSERTVHAHIRNILTKTRTDNRAAATAFAFRHHLV